ncbi:DUF302 domain-containing protein [Actibacterium sp. XHP0104]|uniref:DUF302 domain-containing protein n=1 Tax=Actibacterium sp. XHP0104 TaxID=2984335 RepID=UPI0021E82FF5|nr:DUF302 domain-containing protein [Actibacterium sp. XHP0104]MCV2881894.1 DUF302 domain-containing protein [Actibacterium sp. XHP0104]
MKRLFCALTLGAALSAPAYADQAVTYSTTDSFDDVVFALETAIIGQGLVIDSISHTGDMLERTKADVGSDVTLFTKADIFSFCSASLSRKAMEADHMNLIFCPYDIFVFTRPGSDETVVGYRTFPDGPMQEVQALLDTIAREAAGQD